MFPKIDLARAYHQVSITETDIPKTVIVTSLGLHEFLRMPSGLRSAAQTFQQFINRATRGFDFVFTDVDAIGSNEDHADHPRQLIERLEELGMTINAKGTFA